MDIAPYADFAFVYVECFRNVCCVSVNRRDYTVALTPFHAFSLVLFRDAIFDAKIKVEVAKSSSSSPSPTSSPHVLVNSC